MRGGPFGRRMEEFLDFPDLRIMHTGDLVVWGKRSQGTILTPNMDYAAGSGSGKEWVATLDKMLAIDFDTAIPGHGPMLTKDQVRAFRNKMQTLNERMAALIKGGARKTDIAASNGVIHVIDAVLMPRQ